MSRYGVGLQFELPSLVVSRSNVEHAVKFNNDLYMPMLKEYLVPQLHILNVDMATVWPMTGLSTGKIFQNSA